MEGKTILTSEQLTMETQKTKKERQIPKAQNRKEIRNPHNLSMP